MRLYRQCWLQRKLDQTASREWMTHRRIVGPLVGILMLFIVQEAWGAIRYVSKSGADNSTCAQATPCRSIQHAVDIAIAGDTISIGAGKFPEHFGVSIAKDLTLNGAGIFSTRVHGAWPGFSIFRVESGAVVTIAKLDVMFGNAEYGGGISNLGHLTLDRIRVWKNSATVGGGIYNWNTLYMSKSEIAHNSASDGGGGLHNQGVAELNEVRIVKNYADAGSGGIQNSAGGGWSGDSAFSLVATRSEVSHNAGNGIDNWSGMSLTDTTVSRNHQVGIFTGGAGGYTKLMHVTVAENGKGSDQHPYVSHGGLQWQPDSAIELYNTIVANNAVAQCLKPYGVFAIATTNGLFSDGTCGTWVPGDGNLIGNPKLGPLKWNGGLTFTHALKIGSPAIDAGGASCSIVDQRGVSRPIDGNGDGVAWCDIGAFEYKPKVLEQPH